MTRSTLIPAAVAAILALGGGAAAFAATHDEHVEAPIAAAANQAQFRLDSAVRTAEQTTGGRAIEARMEQRDGSWVYEVETVKDGKGQSVYVSTATGDVVTVASSDAEEMEHSRSLDHSHDN